MRNGVHSIMTSPPVKFHATKLKVVKQPIRPVYTMASTQIEELKSSSDSPDIEEPLFNI